MSIKIKRIYEDATKEDGVRILVDRLWPRGVSKEKAQLDYWFQEIGPSTGLRQWFNHESAKFKSFKEKYKDELQHGKSKEALVELKSIVRNNKQVTTLLFSARNEHENQAVVLKELLDDYINYD